MAVRIENQAEPIPGYKLIERIGGGGFGEVWKAEAPGGLLKAIKFVYGDLETAGDEGMRAEQELKALSRVKTVRHPYILSLERFDIVDGQLLIVMELADRNLWDRFRECRTQGLPGIPREELLRYMDETAEALDLMNIQYQLQHLDIKPQNLFLVHNHAKVADFGLVKDLEGMMASVTGGVTPVYAAPETFDGWISRFCDQYSMGIVYQELLTGQRPFNGTNVRQLILQHLQASPNLTPLPPADRDAIGRALAKNPDDRFASCMELVRALRGSSSTAQEAQLSGAHDSRPEIRLTHSSAGVETPLRTPPGMTVAQEPPGPADDDAEVALESPSGNGEGWIRVQSAADQENAAPPPITLLPPEVRGDGVLVPALVIGLGHLGLGVLQRLRANLQSQFGSLESLPNIRLLYIDSDVDAARQAARGLYGAPLRPAEILQTRLNRPSHYLRSKEGRARIDSWFNPKMLYRIPRNLQTTGLRALGRLALLDNYAGLTRRLREELLKCADPDTLAKVAQRGGLGLRSTTPRVYVVTGLGGGTGSGMFLDLAYVVKHHLKELGCSQPEVNGVFFLPAVDRHPARVLALGNAFAALTELNHFSTPGTTFSARYEEKEKPLSDPEPPYARTLMLQLPEGVSEESPKELFDLSADYLFRELATPLGRVTEDYRANMPSPGRQCPGPTYQTFGLYRISWPRQALQRNVARRLCQNVVQHWMSKDAGPVREAVQATVAEVWEKQELSGENLLTRLQAVCKEALGEKPETILSKMTAPLEELDTRSVEGLPEAAASLLTQFERLLGRPETNVGNRGGELDGPLNAAADALIATHSQRLATFAVRLVEQPQFRLAGTEEAMRQMIAILEQSLQNHKGLCKEFTERTTEAHGRIWSILATLQAGTPTERRKIASTTSALIELLRIYPNWRYQSLLLKRVLNIYVSLRGHLSDQLREINYCRDRLGDLRRGFENPDRNAPINEEGSCGRSVYPFGCRNLNETAKRLLEGISPRETYELDCKIQNVIRQQFTSLVHVCMTPSNLLQNLEMAMQHEAEGFVASRLADISVTDLYMAHHSNDEQIDSDLEEMFDSAAPQLNGQQIPAQSELRVLATPPGQASERFQELAQGVASELKMIAASGLNDIVFYRESPRLALAELSQLGPLAYEAYRQMSGVESFTPHSRTDISEWRAAVVT